MAKTQRRDRVYEFGPFRLEARERRLLRAGLSVPLRPKTFDTLLLLVESSGLLLGKEQMLAALWPDTVVEETNLAHNVSVLRKVLGAASDETGYIETVPRQGYRFSSPVSEVNAGGESEPTTSLESPSSATVASQSHVDAGSPSRASIAVLPFVNISSDPEQEFFCDGMAEEVLDALAQVDGLHVVARTSSFQFRGENVDAREIGERLGVSALLEGSVRKVGERLRITAQLIQTSSGYHLWSRRYDRVLSDVFEIQDEIATSIVKRLKAELLGEVRGGRLVKRPAIDMETYNLYIEARYHFSAETREGIERAIALLKRVLELEPEYGPAWASLARCYPTMSGYGMLPIEEALPEAERAAARALEIDDSLADAHLAAGTIRAWLHADWLGAQQSYRRALELSPASAEVHHAYLTLFLAPAGRLGEAESAARHALDLDPLSPMRSRVLGQVLFWSRQYEASVDQLRHTLELDPDYPLTRQLLAAVYTSMGRPTESLQERQTHLRRIGREEIAAEIGRLYEEGGEPALLRWQVERGLQRAASGNGDVYGLALLYSLLDEKDEAIRWLAEAVEQKGSLVIYAKVHPWLDNLRKDPRFDGLMDRLGLNDPRLASPDDR